MGGRRCSIPGRNSKARRIPSCGISCCRMNTVLYFPGLRLASASMSAYVIGEKGGALSQDRTFLLLVSMALLRVAVQLNIIGLNIGKWLQNAGGVGTYVPLLVLVGVAVLVYFRSGSATHFTAANMIPTWNWDTVNFW